jgi:hypothetical protein
MSDYLCQADLIALLVCRECVSVKLAFPGYSDVRLCGIEFNDGAKANKVRRIHATVKTKLAEGLRSLLKREEEQANSLPTQVILHGR